MKNLESSLLKLEYLFEDAPLDENASFCGFGNSSLCDGSLEHGKLSDYTTLDFVSSGNHIYGEIMWPSGEFSQMRPCVIMLHGFPGSARNDDISHALCRIGCVVIVPHHRGAWGSQGKYLITNCIEDAKNLAEYAHSDDFCQKYNVDFSKIFLLGHSMGANSALNAGRTLDWIRGIIMLTPYDPTRYLNRDKEVFFHSLLQEGKILNSDGIDAIYDDVVKNRDKISFPLALEQVKNKNLLIFGGSYDSVSPIDEMIMPLWTCLEKLRIADILESEKKALHAENLSSLSSAEQSSLEQSSPVQSFTGQSFSVQSSPVQRFIEYPTEHGLLGRRISVIRDIATFIKDCCEQE